MVKKVSPYLMLFLIVMTMKSKMGDDVFDDPGLSTSATFTQRGVMVRIMIERCIRVVVFVYKCICIYLFVFVSLVHLPLAHHRGW